MTRIRTRITRISKQHKLEEFGNTARHIVEGISQLSWHRGAKSADIRKGFLYPANRRRALEKHERQYAPAHCGTGRGPGNDLQ